jgi:heme-degrading monooxygenase HmoA
VLVHISIHRPIAGKEGDLIDSMHRFGRADGEIPGLREVHTLRDRETGTLVGLALWDSEEAFQAGVPRMRTAVEGDDLLSWEHGVPEVYLLDPV